MVSPTQTLELLVSPPWPPVPPGAGTSPRPQPAPGGGWQIQGVWESGAGVVALAALFTFLGGVGSWAMLNHAQPNPAPGHSVMNDEMFWTLAALGLFSGLATIILAVKAWHERRYGLPTLQLEHSCLRAGDTATLHYLRPFKAGVKVGYSGTVDARLVCSETTTTGAGDDAEVKTRVLWQRELGTFPVYEGVGQVEAEWPVHLPSDAAASATAPGRQVVWRLQVRHNIPGQLRGITDFVLPVVGGGVVESTVVSGRK